MYVQSTEYVWGNKPCGVGLGMRIVWTGGYIVAGIEYPNIYRELGGGQLTHVCILHIRTWQIEYSTAHRRSIMTEVVHSAAMAHMEYGSYQP